MKAPMLAIVIALGAPALADCPRGDLMALDGVRVIPAAAQAAIPGRFLAEGAEGGVALREPAIVDFGTLRTLRALLLQAQGEAAVLVESSTDGVRFERFTSFPEAVGGGQRARSSGVVAPRPARYLRVSRAGAPGPLRLSALSAWCEPPERPQEIEARIGARRTGVQIARFALAAAGSVLLAWLVWWPPRTPRVRRVTDLTLATLGLAAACAWWNFGFFHYGSYLHLHEQFHYFLGGKYFRELGYARLYDCVTVADLEDARGTRAGSRMIRDMETNALVDASPLADRPETCTAHFSASRWKAFKTDVGWFREAIPPERWERLFRDHGFNAPPAWVLAGGALTSRVRATRASVLALALIDPVLLVAMGALVIHVFGWRAASIAALWWGTNRFADFGWTGGGLLRQDWLVLAVAGIALVRTGRTFAGGFAIGWSALLRVFPGLLLAGLALQVLVRSIAARRLAFERVELRVGAGSLAAVALLVPLSCASSGGVAAWRAFVEEARANLRSTGANMVGLMAPLSYEHAKRLEATRDPAAPDPEARWLAAKRAVHERRTGVRWVLAAGFVVLLAFAVRGEPAWASLALATGLVPVVGFVASYYCSIFLVFGLLVGRRGPAVGVWLCLLSVASHVTAWAWPEPMRMDTRFAWASVATVSTVLAITILFVRRPRSLPPEWIS